MTVNRDTYRRELAALLRTRLDGLVQAVYDYQAGDFKGASPVVIVTNAGTERGNPLVANESAFLLEVHTFVLYALQPINLTEDIDSGTEVLLLFDDTSIFTVGQELLLEGTDESEKVTVTVVTEDESITLEEVLNNYTTVKLHVWTEEQSENLIDELEYQISDEIRLANDKNNMGLSIVPESQSLVDVVEIGGDAYRHETIPVRVTVIDY
jgi:hypothetical protein